VKAKQRFLGRLSGFLCVAETRTQETAKIAVCFRCHPLHHIPGRTLILGHDLPKESP
jgi:hypothetical protein